MPGKAGAPTAGSARPQLVATDLDGTLLRSDGTASARTGAVLRAVQAQGVQTVLVTARPPRWLHDLTHLVGDGGVALCGNGAFVYDVHSRRLLAEHGIEPAVVDEIVADLRKAFPSMAFGAERRSGFGREETFGTASDEPVGKLLGRLPDIRDDAFVEEVSRIVGERGVVAYSGAGGLAEISAPGVTKAVALADWCTRLEVAADDVWAFGDMPNDLPMLAWAGKAFAVANAHPDVLDAADHVVPSNDDDGVAATLEGILDPSSTGGVGETP